MFLPLDRRGQLLHWLIEMDKRDWDYGLEEKFSGKSPDVPLLDQVKEEASPRDRGFVLNECLAPDYVNLAGITDDLITGQNRHIQR